MGRSGSFPDLPDYASRVIQYPVELYVDAVNGSDNNPGGPDSPLQTLIEAARRLPHATDFDVVVRVMPGTYAPPVVSPRLYRAPIGFVGVGEETMVVGTVDAGATTTVITVTSGGLTVNAHRGQFLRIGTEQRLIVANAANSITVARALSAAPPAATSFTVFRPPAVVIDWDLAPNLNMVLEGGPAGSTAGAGLAGNNSSPGLLFANMRFAGGGAANPVLMYLTVSGICSLYGVEFTEQIQRIVLSPGGSLGIGAGPASTTLTTSDPVRLRLVGSVSDWHGYGASFPSTLSGRLTISGSAGGGGRFFGYFVAPSMQVDSGAQVDMPGGAIFGGASGAGVNVGSTLSGARAFFSTSGTLGDIVIITGAAAQPAVLVQGEGECSIAHATGSSIAATGAAEAAIIVQAAGVLLASSSTVTGGTYGLWVRNGGRAIFTGTGSLFTGTTAKFAAGPAPATKNTNWAVNEVLKEAAYATFDGSVIVRVS